MVASRLPFPILGSALALALLGCSTSTDSPAPSAQSFKSPRLLGTFVSQDILHDGDWRACFKAMKAAGLTQAVVNHSADASAMTTRYPTALPGFTMVYPTLPAGFPNATVQGVDMYLGLQSSEDWWNNSTDPVWLAAQAALANQVADELWALYKAEPTFKGWYLPFEADNVTFPTSDAWDLLAGFYKTVADHLHSIAPGKPVIIAPFFNPAYGLDAAGWRSMWAYILATAPIDIIALQDGVGAGNTTLDVLPEWFAATKGAIADANAKCQLWSDTETYQIADWSTMPIGSLVADIQAVTPYVTGMLSWSFADYLNPQRVNPSYYETYRQYAVSGVVDLTPPTAPAGLRAVAQDPTTVALTWTPSVDNIGIVGYRLTRNSTSTFLRGTAATFLDTGLDPGTQYTYNVAGVDAAGNQSGASVGQVVTTPVDPYVLDLALGKTYTTTSEADANHPDSGGGLTDGIYGPDNPWDAAWQGRQNGGNTWVINLGSVQTIHEVISSWLNDQPDYCYLPTSITYAVSSNGVDYTDLGTVIPAAPADLVKRLAFRVTNVDVQGQYVKVTVLTQDGSWSFIDEIEVRQ